MSGGEPEKISQRKQTNATASAEEGDEHGARAARMGTLGVTDEQRWAAGVCVGAARSAFVAEVKGTLSTTDEILKASRHV